MTVLVQKKDWQGLKDQMLQQQEITAEEVDVTVMMAMMMFKASSEDLQQYLSNFKQLSSEHAKRLSVIASPAHRELFKAAGFELPFNAEAAKMHQQLLELQQRMKKSEQRRAETKQ
jgi:hypothetical protein